MNIIEKIQSIFLSQEEVKLEAFQTADGKSLEVAALEVGQVPTIDGEAAQEGEVILEDGRILVINAEGKIAEIKDAPVEDAAPAEMSEEVAEAPVESETETDATTDSSEEAPEGGELESRITELESALMLIAEQVNELKGEKAQVEAELSAIKEENNKLKEENQALNVKPAATAAKFSKVEIKSDHKLGKYAELIRTARNN